MTCDEGRPTARPSVSISSARPFETEPPKRIAVFRALQLGDMLCAVPALRALRTTFPHAEITLIGLPWAREFAARFDGYLNDFLEFPGYPGLPEMPFDPDAFERFLQAAHERRFDLAIQMHGSGNVTNPLVEKLGAPVNAGFFATGQDPPDSGRFFAWPERGSEIHRLLDLVAFLGIPLAGEHLEFPIREDDERRGAESALLHGLLPGQYVCVHPGARFRSRRWPVERFAKVCQRLADRGKTIVLTGSTSEAPLAEEIARRVSPRPLNVAGQTDLGMLAVLIRDAALLICNDTGVSHVAAAVATPSVVVACGTDVERWRPLDQALHRTLYTPIECRPCGYDDCPIGHPCALDIDARMVLSAADDVVAREIAVHDP